jgi:hypothetical protein
MNITARCKSKTIHDTTPASGSVRLQEVESSESIDISIRSPEWLATFEVGQEYTISITPA